MYLSRVRAAFAAVFTRAWLVEVREASLRQAYQILVPMLLTVAAQGNLTSDALKAALLGLAGGQIVVIVRRLAGLTVPDGSGVGAVLAARALSAFAGAISGYILAVPVAGVLSLEWPAIVISACSTALLALLHGWFDPAATDVLADAPAGGEDA